MTTYAIFNQKYDCEIWVNLKVGTLESMDTVKELIGYQMDADSSLEGGYVESYPFFQADWQIVGGRFEPDFDFDQVLKVENDWRIFEEEKTMKEFECFWGDGYRGEDNRSLLAYHNEDFFNQERGYELRDIENIKNLHIGEDYNMDAVFGEHWVRRIA